MAGALPQYCTYLQLLALAVGICTVSSKYDYIGTIWKLNVPKSAEATVGDKRRGPDLQTIKAKVAFYCGKGKAGAAGSPTWHMELR